MNSTAYYTNAQHATAKVTQDELEVCKAGYLAGYEGTEYIRPITQTQRLDYRKSYKQGMADKVYADNSESAIDKIKSDLSSVGITAVVKVKLDMIHDIYTVYNGRSIVAKGQLADVQNKVSVYVSTEKSLQADYKNFKY